MFKKIWKNAVQTEMKYNVMSREHAMANIRGSYPSEEVIENYYSDGSSDDEDEQDTVTQEQEKRFMMELNRLGLKNAFVTTTNTQISSFGYDRQKDKNTMSLFAVLQNQNKREMKSVLNGDADDVEVEFKLNDDSHSMILTKVTHLTNIIRIRLDQYFP